MISPVQIVLLDGYQLCICGDLLLTSDQVIQHIKECRFYYRHVSCRDAKETKRDACDRLPLTYAGMIETIYIPRLSSPTLEVTPQARRRRYNENVKLSAEWQYRISKYAPSNPLFQHYLEHKHEFAYTTDGDRQRAYLAETERFFTEYSGYPRTPLFWFQNRPVEIIRRSTMSARQHSITAGDLKQILYSVQRGKQKPEIRKLLHMSNERMDAAYYAIGTLLQMGSLWHSASGSVRGGCHIDSVTNDSDFVRIRKAVRFKTTEDSDDWRDPLTSAAHFDTLETYGEPLDVAGSLDAEAGFSDARIVRLFRKHTPKNWNQLPCLRPPVSHPSSYYCLAPPSGKVKVRVAANCETVQKVPWMSRAKYQNVKAILNSGQPGILRDSSAGGSFKTVQEPGIRRVTYETPKDFYHRPMSCIATRELLTNAKPNTLAPAGPAEDNEVGVWKRPDRPRKPILYQRWYGAKQDRIRVVKHWRTPTFRVADMPVPKQWSVWSPEVFDAPMWRTPTFAIRYYESPDAVAKADLPPRQGFYSQRYRTVEDRHAAFRRLRVTTEKVTVWLGNEAFRPKSGVLTV